MRPRRSHPARRIVGCGLLLALASFALTAAPSRAEVPRGWDEAFSDGYTRVTAHSWGRHYSLAGATGSASVNGDTADVTLTAGHGLSARINPVQAAADVDVADTATLDLTAASSFDVFHGWELRGQADGSGYQARVRLRSHNRLSLGLSRTNGTRSTWLDSVVLPIAGAGDAPFRGEFQVVGTTPVILRARVWRAGGDKPAWQVRYSDDSDDRVSTAGSVTLSSFVQAADGPVTVSMDDLSVGTSGIRYRNTGPPSLHRPRGSAPVGVMRYPVPDDAVYVSVTGSDDNPGTEARPVRTARVASILAPDGGTVVMRTGVYHETMRVEDGKSLTIQNYPGEAVWFDGSTVVQDWTKSGNYWVHRGWTTEFSSMMGHDAAFKARFIGQNPMAADPDQVFLNGVPLRQVASPDEVVEGTFYVSDLGNAIAIGSDPTGKEVRASDLARAIVMTGRNSVVQGIGVRRYANGYEKGGAVKLGNIGNTIRNVVIRDVATVGLSVTNTRVTVDHVTIRRAGQLGIAGYHNDDSVVRNSVVSGNNTELFKDAPVSGGMKLCAARRISVENNEVSDNTGTGIWFDVSNYDMAIVNNSTDNNTKYGIEVEVSQKAVIANNHATGGEAGITVFDSGDVKVFNNELGDSTQMGVKLIQDERRQAALGDFNEARDPRYLDVVDPDMPWLTRDLHVSNNVFGSGGWFQVFALDGKTDRAVDDWNLTVDGNLFNPRPTKKDATMVAWGRGDAKTVERYETPDALAEAKGNGWRNAQVASPKALASLIAHKGEFAGVAVPLPAEVAAVTGLPVGERLLGVR